MLLGSRRSLSFLCAAACVVVASQNIAWAQSGGFVDSSTGARQRPKLKTGVKKNIMPQPGVLNLPAPH
jgi:hypothetical protein